jgi:hypothetical protein
MMFNRWVPAAKMYYVIVILTLQMQKQALSKIEDSCIPFQPTPALREEGKAVQSFQRQSHSCSKGFDWRKRCIFKCRFYIRENDAKSDLQVSCSF